MSFNFHSKLSLRIQEDHINGTGDTKSQFVEHSVGPTLEKVVFPKKAGEDKNEWFRGMDPEGHAHEKGLHLFQLRAPSSALDTGLQWPPPCCGVFRKTSFAF